MDTLLLGTRAKSPVGITKESIKITPTISDPCYKRIADTSCAPKNISIVLL